MVLKRFNMISENFVCENCGKNVEKLEYTARDHCPYCLCSKHVDINPGDREETCHGILRPIDIEKNKKAGYKIVYKCEKCKKIHKNIAANDDSFDEIIKVMQNKD